MNIKSILFELAAAAGTSGDEKAAAITAEKYLSEFMSCSCDKLSNVVGTTKGGKVHILLDAHLDQIGLVVRGIDSNGFILVDKVGGMDLRTLIGAEVTVYGKEELFGVICSVPPHLQSGDKEKELLELKKMAVDIGYSEEKAKKLVSIGDRITVRCCQHELAGKNISSSAFDNRSSVAAILRAVEMVYDKIDNVKLTVLFSSQEETGGSGAKVGAFSAMPDYAIVVDVGFGDDPYTDKSQTISLGKGPSIGISPTLDRELTMDLKALAERKEIPYQHDVMGGRTGTNADSINIAGAGVKTALLSVPLRYMHTANEVINIDDVENTARLIAEFILETEEKYNA